jgi:8-oxo-dGTP pyrophosphatase MutT (NUDIX family)
MDRLVDIYPYKRVQDKIKLLILKRSADVIYAGQWRMVGGKVKQDEKAPEAALRELEEETYLQPRLFWTLPSINQFYDPEEDTVRQIPAFAAEVNPDKEISLNHEHAAYQWITAAQVASYIQWPEQRRLMNLLTSIVTHNQLINEWILEH